MSKMHQIPVYLAVSMVAFGICITVAASALYVIVCRRRMKKKEAKQSCFSCSKSVDLEMQQLNLSVRTTSEKQVSFESSSQMESLDDRLLPTTPRKRKTAVVESYTVEELSIATAEFCTTNLIDGYVYHGRLNGKNVAIKCTDPETISKIRFELFSSARPHPNIIRLLGICTSVDSHVTATRSRFLVFEYAENGSLKDWIHGGLAMKSHFIASCSCFLTWNQRLKICLDVATAIQFMHSITTPSYVHQNIKTRNIFLDKEFQAKVGNFGMEECIKDGSYPEEVPSSGYLESNYPTNWDNGYMAPEYLNSGVISPSIDIYAFGVVLLEILSGKQPIKAGKSENQEDGCRLSETIKGILRSDNPLDELREWMDKGLDEKYPFDAAMALANLARACVEDDPLLRPVAGEVVVRLSELMAAGEEKAVARESSCGPLVDLPFAIKSVHDY